MFRRISDNLYWREPQHYSDRPVIGYVRGSESSLLFEAGASAMHAREICRELSALGLPLPKYVALSHWHWDHSFGLSEWEKLVPGVVTIAGSMTNDMLYHLSGLPWDEEAVLSRVASGQEIEFCYKKMKLEFGGSLAGVHVVPAAVSFDGRYCLDLGGVEVELIHIGGPHSADSVVCHVPSERFVFLGDSSGKDLYAKPWHFDLEDPDSFEKGIAGIEYDSDALKNYLDDLRRLEFDSCVTGHGEPCSKAELLAGF